MVYPFTVEVRMMKDAEPDPDQALGPYDCSLCKTPLKLVPSPDGRRFVVEVASGERHGCWQTYPKGAEILVIEDP